jgi:hypothetical protein
VPCSTTRRRRVHEQEVSITEEARIAPQNLLGTTPGVPVI